MTKWAKSILIAGFFAISGCKPALEANQLKLAISAEYPPFEYKVGGEIRGFDVDLAKLIAKELGKELVFEDMQFSTILPALQSGHVDAAISMITVTEERKQSVDFSEIYYFDGISAIYKDSQPIHSKDDLVGKKIACQLGSTMEIWLKKNGFTKQIVAMDNNIQAIEALKADHVDVVLVDGAQGQTFSKKNAQLSSKLIDQSKDGYAIAFQKGSPLLAEINQVIKKLKQNGEITKLEEKWLTGELQ